LFEKDVENKEAAHLTVAAARHRFRRLAGPAESCFQTTQTDKRARLSGGGACQGSAGCQREGFSHRMAAGTRSRPLGGEADVTFAPPARSICGSSGPSPSGHAQTAVGAASVLQQQASATSQAPEPKVRASKIPATKMARTEVNITANLPTARRDYPRDSRFATLKQAAGACRGRPRGIAAMALAAGTDCGSPQRRPPVGNAGPIGRLADVLPESGAMGAGAIVIACDVTMISAAAGCASS
jgi:hypothetical protein